MQLLITLFLIFANTVSLPFDNGTEQKIQSILEERDQQIKELLGPEGTDYTDAQRDRLRNIVNDMMDYREMARFALADTFDELEPEEQEEFVGLFSQIIRDQSLRQLNIYRAEVIYEDIEVSDDSATVTTTAILEDNRIPVLYRMKQKEDEWVITDMSIDDAWTAESYRRSFRNIIRRRGFEALLKSLRKKVEKS